MKSKKVFSPAKLNLFLQILFQREDGYHEIDSLFAKVNFGDTLTFTEKKEGIELRCSGDYKVPNNAENLVYKAADLMRSKAQGKRGVKIELEKHVPTGAGLGGGSSNAALTLKTLNDFWGVHLAFEELLELGKKLGADVPFFLYGETFARVQGLGEKIIPLSSLDTGSLHKPFDSFIKTPKDYKVLLIKPKYISIESSWAYDELKKYYKGDYLKSQSANTFEDAIFSLYPDLKAIKNTLLSFGAQYTAMTGSGSVIFGVFEKSVVLEDLIQSLKERGDVTICDFF